MSRHDRERKLKRTAVIHRLNVGLTDQDIVGMMRHARDARAKGAPSVTCCIDDYNDDPREIGEIPEARELCRRLLALGYTSFLDPTTSIPEFPTFNGCMTLGAFEVWRIARGEMTHAGRQEVTRADLDAFREHLEYANTVADDHLADS
jgi:hypothetical protein